jgi:hypothetical protein
MSVSDTDWQEITIAIADTPVTISIQDQVLGAQMMARYKDFVREQQPEFKVAVQTFSIPVSPNFMAEVVFHYDANGNKMTFDLPGFNGDIDLDSNTANLFTSNSRVIETTDYLLRVIFALLIFKKGGVLFHGAGIVRDGYTYLFFGHSGSGKSTVARFSPHDTVLNDDLVVLMPHGDGWTVFATPFWNPTQVRPVHASAPLKGLYRLVQDKQVFLEPLGAGHALAELISNVPVIPENRFLNMELFIRGRQLLDGVPAYRLHFLPDDSFWQVITAGI